MIETWKSIPGFETKYEVSDWGQVRSLPRHTGHQRISGTIIRSRKGDNGYRSVNLWSGNKAKTVDVHRLVCRVFHGEPPQEGAEVNHKDGNKDNNSSGNLEWMTRPENQLHAADMNLKPHGEASHLSKLTLAQVEEIRALKGKMPQRKIAELYGVNQSCICKILRNLKWRNN